MVRKPTYKELERKISKDNKAFAIVFIGLLFFAILSAIIVIQKDKLQAENEALREQIPVWTLKVFCQENENDFTLNQTLEFQYFNYESYENVLKYIKKNENCEVIK